MIVFLLPIFIFLGVNNLSPCFHFLSFRRNHQKFIFRFSNSSINLSLCFTCQVIYQFHFLLGAISLEFFFLLQSRSCFLRSAVSLESPFAVFILGIPFASPLISSLHITWFPSTLVKHFFPISFMNKKINRM